MATMKIRSVSLIILSVCVTSQMMAGEQLTGSVTQTFSGTLFDTMKASCSVEVTGSSTPGTCPVSVCTASFGIRLRDGKLYKLDEGGNQKAASALRKSRNGSSLAYSYWKTGKASRPVMARATGTLTGDTLNVDSIDIQ